LGKNKNILWIDYLRVFATFGVIIVHTTYALLYKYGSVSSFDWWTGNFYGSFVRFGVPIFLIISGTLILPKTYQSIGEYLKKRFLRILFPFLFWSFIYIAGNLYLKIAEGEHLTIFESLKFILVQFRDGASFHLWYIYLILGLYLFFPIIGKWLNNSSKREIEYFIVIWLIAIFAALPFMKNFVPKIEIMYFSGYIGFPVLGYYLSKTAFNFDGKKSVYLLFVLAGVAVTMFGTNFIVKQEGFFVESFYNYLTPNVILLSAGIFLLFKNFAGFSEKTNSVIIFIGKYSYGIYLVHILVLWLLAKFGFSYTLISPIVGIPITGFLCLIISTFIIFIINKIPFGKYISG